MANEKKMKKLRLMPWFIWIIAASFFLIQYISRVAPSVMIPELMHHFSITALTVGSISAFFYYSYVGMQLPVGMLVDRFGVKRLLILALICATLGCILFAETNSLKIAYLARFLLGFGGAFAFVGAIKLAANWFPSNRLGMLVGSTQALGMLGAVVGEAPIAFLIPHIGWQNSILAIGGLFVIIGILIIFFVKNAPAHSNDNNTQETKSSIWESLSTVVKNKQSWINALYVGMIYAPIAAFSELWGVSCLEQLYHLKIDVAAMASSIVFVGWTIGAPVMGIISDRIGKRRPLMFFSAILGVILLSAILYMPSQPLYLLFIELFLFGATNAGVAISYTLSSEINPKKFAGTSIAFANMASVLIGTICQPLIGWFLDLQWDGEMLHGIRAYSSSNYQWAMLILVACLVVGLFASFFIKETYCKNVDELA